ncbi:MULTISPECIES: UPF0147 family protein [Candidatus Nitrosotenuis]|jgi:uncharacterized protein (UPF0147 family)|uniref:UPF0147 family protein n=1 Tax=Candidatus Nitrosotenuis TaxID=1825023 RepID=UPI0005B2BE87|nr:MULTISPECIES: UPF0147 family protein [Nitrosotenuis]QLH08364.1 hypothetical protein DSQ19_01690 [Candidatus Nitrosotenuis sp. DW1]
MADKKAQNQTSFDQAIQTLVQVVSNPTTPKNIKKNLTDLISSLRASQDPISVRAANAISQLDDVSQDPNMPSYVRVTLWQAVSALEGIRE